MRVSVDGEFDEMLRRDKLVVADQSRQSERLEARRARLLDGFTDGLVDKADFAERQGQIDRELRDARKLIARASRLHVELKARVEVNLQLLRRAGQLYELLPDDGRQTLNQVRYEALEIDVNEGGTVFVAERELTEVAEAIELVADDVREEKDETGGGEKSGGGSSGGGSGGGSERRHSPPRRPSGFHGGSQHPKDLAYGRRRAGTKNTARLDGDRCSNLVNLAERGGFRGGGHRPRSAGQGPRHGTNRGTHAPSGTGVRRSRRGRRPGRRRGQRR